MTSPAAMFDTLFLCDRISRSLRDATFSELHAFGYLSCILSVFEGQPSSDWGYEFAGTADGAPYSHDIAAAVDQLVAVGWLSGHPERYRLSEFGLTQLRLLENLELNRARTRFLGGAAESLLAVAPGDVRFALSSEPGLARYSRSGSSSHLLGDADRRSLYEQYGALRAAIGLEEVEPVIPAVAWLTYLLRMQSLAYETREESP